MARTVKEVRLQERSARARLPIRHHPYWRTISAGRHVGYYRGARGGSWIARCRQPGSTEPYATIALGSADDAIEADGTVVLNWRQALAAASKWFEERERDPQGPDLELTVNSALDAYVAMRDARDSARAGRTVRSDAHHRLKRYVKGDTELPSMKLQELTELHLKSWQDRVRGLKRTSKQRLISDLKAALNACFLDYRRSLPPDLPVTIKYGLQLEIGDWDATEPVARDNQILNDQQVRDLIKLAFETDSDGDFAMLVIVLAATGARFSQIKRMRVQDVQVEQSRLLVPTSRKGKGRTGRLIKIQVGPDVIQALAPVLAGREATETLLERWRYRQTSPTKWEQVARGAWNSASEMTRPWKRVVQAAGLPEIVPYALRHSSIVRGIRAGLPIRLVAALHDTSVAMIEGHYSRWITEGLEEVAAKAIVPLLAA